MDTALFTRRRSVTRVLATPWNLDGTAPAQGLAPNHGFHHGFHHEVRHDVRPFFLLLPLAALVACTDTDVEGFALKGMVLDAGTLSPAAEGLCMHAIDPTAALAGGEIDVLASTVLGANGAFALGDIVYSDTRLMMLAADCGDEGTVMPTATGVDPTAYDGIEPGGVVDERVALSVDARA
ncbi:MAG: hypothetical protein GY913_16650 [Proteobacteria bacterium]|nr:hypothetical protein [Pseudomonadota bacterium]MCP4918535.1 hypothetical protein [Pseudomonadota bacterium]